MRQSTESQVSGISGILANTQLTGFSSINTTHLRQSMDPRPTSLEKGVTATVITHGSNELKVSKIHHKNTTLSPISDRILGPLQQSTGSNVITQSPLLTNQYYSSIEQAQPVLKLCLVRRDLAESTSVVSAGGQFVSIFSNDKDADPVMDPALVCPRCQHIAIQPVECVDCQYLICYHCAQAQSMTCGKLSDSDGGCGQQFTRTPGKIHKLYRRLFALLEFRCPNSHHGCVATLKYEQVDQHLRQHCEYREVPCPNGCSENE